MLAKFNKVLVLAPHTDDGEIGCGGTISKLIEEGSEVYYLAFSSAKQSLKEKGLNENTLIQETKEATKVLGIKKNNLTILNYDVRNFDSSRQKILDEIVKFKDSFKPDLILMPSLRDIHQDHIVIAQEGLRAFKNSIVLSYEMIWNNLNFNHSIFIKLSKKNVEDKWNALKKYRSQKSRSYMSKDFIHSLARTRGVQIRSKYAESFEVVRWVM